MKLFIEVHTAKLGQMRRDRDITYMSVSFGRTDRKQSGVFASHLILFS